MKNKQPLISIVTVTYNLIKNGRKRSFLKCVDSIRKINSSLYEHLIIDGDSNDGTVNLLNNLSSNRLRYVSEPDSGVYDAMNKGIKNANGKYILFINSDDYLLNCDNLLSSIKLMELNKIEYGYSDITEINSLNGKAFGIWKANINRLIFGTHFCHQGVIALKSLLKKYLFDTSIKVSADSDQTIRIFADDVPMLYLPHSFSSYSSGGYSNLHPELNRVDHSKSFYKHIGKYFKLSYKDCYNFWNFSLFYEMDINEALVYGKKLINEKWRYEFFQQFVDMVECGQLQFGIHKPYNGGGPMEQKIVSFYRNIKHLLIPQDSIRFKVVAKTRKLITG